MSLQGQRVAIRIDLCLSFLGLGALWGYTLVGFDLDKVVEGGAVVVSLCCLDP